MASHTERETHERAASEIRAGTEIVTLINVFSVTPERQRALADLLIAATEETIRYLPGFVSANIHTSYDGQRVINYAQWRSRDDYTSMRQHTDAQPHLASAAAMAEFDPILCEVTHVDHA